MDFSSLDVKKWGSGRVCPQLLIPMIACLLYAEHCEGLWIILIQRQDFTRAREVKCGGSCRVLKVGMWQTKPPNSFLQYSGQFREATWLIEIWETFTLSSNFILWKHPFLFYDTISFLPDSVPPLSSNVYPKSCWTPCEAIYIPPSLKMFPSQIQCLNSLGKFTLSGLRAISGTAILWPLLRSTIPGNETWETFLDLVEGPSCIQWEHKDSRTCKPGISSEKVKWGLVEESSRTKKLIGHFRILHPWHLECCSEELWKWDVHLLSKIK
jgi:hypothetical protein